MECYFDYRNRLWCFDSFSMDILFAHRGSIEALGLIDPVQKERKR
jgi:hypothetical protein